MKRWWLMGLVPVFCLVGCEQVEVKAVRAAGGEVSEAEVGFGASVSFCRRVGTKTGKRIRIDDSFPVREGKKYRYVHGFVDLTDVAPSERHQVHLVWLRPDGKEMFRRFGTVEVTPGDEGYTTRVTWLDAEDLHKVKAEEPVVSETPDVTLSSRLNVRPEKEREAGTYTLKVYWNRELLTSGGFELTVSG